MCTVSMIMDHYREKWEPYVQPQVVPYWQQMAPFVKHPAISEAEIEEFRTLLARAREYDKRNNEPDCEMAEKREAILKIAKALGVEIAFL